MIDRSERGSTCLTCQSSTLTLVEVPWESTKMHVTHKIKNSYKINVPVTFWYFNVLSISNLKRTTARGTIIQYILDIMPTHFVNQKLDRTRMFCWSFVLWINPCFSSWPCVSDVSFWCTKSRIQNPESKIQKHFREYSVFYQFSLYSRHD